MQPAIFLDRDGVIIENRSAYVRSWEDVSFYPGALEALADLNTTPYKIVIVTNQSAVGRGIISLETALEINQRVVETIERNGGRVDGVFMCPHSPFDDCECRKPRPGLIHQAVEALSIDLSQSILVGDAQSDLLAGQSAGIEKVALVRTGRGKSQETLPKPEGLKPFLIFDSIAEALGSLIHARGAEAADTD